jgi:response regulator RpfG family c-di-GMP phosphodiesterase
MEKEKGRIKIFIIEDKPEEESVIFVLLKSLGYSQITHYLKVWEAFEALHSNFPDLVIIDLDSIESSVERVNFFHAFKTKYTIPSIFILIEQDF